MKKIVLIIGIFVFSYTNISAQIADSMFMEFQKFTQDINDEYNAFKDAIWKEFNAMKPLKSYDKPKPVKPPEIIPEEIPEEPKPVAPKPIVVKPKPKIKLPVDDFSARRTDDFKKKLREIVAHSSNNTNINFYGANFKLYYNDIDFNLSEVSNKSILSSYQYLTDKKSKDIDNIVTQLVEYACVMKLNDYAFMKLSYKSALAILKNQNKANLFTWLVMNTNKYDCKLAYTEDNKLYLIIPSETTMFGLPYFEMNSKRYYILPSDKKETNKLPHKFRTYVDNPLESDKIIDFNFAQAPTIGSNFSEMQRDMPNINKDFELKYNVNYVEMLKDMPILEHEQYFYIPMSKQTFNYIKQKFEPMLQGKSELEKVKFLLAFVQQGFPYKYDIENFGYPEQPLAPEEVLCYSHCDCEDHAALFTYLVATLTDCEVVGVLYKDHATTAVKFKTARPKGYYLPAPYNNYVLCEPTISNGVAPIGMVGAQYVGVTPEKVFKLDKNILLRSLK